MSAPRRRLPAAARREQLVAAAIDAVAEVGFRACTAELVAQRAGVSKGLLWHHFRDLDDLFLQAARHALDVQRSAAAAALDLTAPAPEVIRRAVHGAVELRTTHAAHRRAIAEIARNLRGPDGELLLGTADLDELHAAQAELFRRGQQRGEFDAGLDPLLLAITYQAAVGALLEHLDRTPDADPVRCAEQLADVLLSGVLQRG